MSAAWHLLGTPGHKPELPPLLVTTAFTANSYAIYLTDLTFIWNESLDRRSIIRRSIDEDTSIDPSEDAEQLRLFLQKIQLGLEGGEGTSLTLSRSSSGLNLCTTATLPKGLRPLEWTIRLSRAGQSVLTSRLVMPLLRAQNSCIRELEALLGMLHEKDHVIQKLADKLEATGADLGQLFPGATLKGRRKLPRDVAEERIRGLRKFEVAAWREKMEEEAAAGAENNEVGILVETVFGHKYGSTLKAMADSALPETWDQWWNSLDYPILLCRGKDSLNKSSPVDQKINEPKALEDDIDVFQVQATPPHLSRFAEQLEQSKLAQLPTTKPIVDDSTDSGDNLDTPSQHTVLDSYPLGQSKPQARQIGSIGSSRTANWSQASTEAAISKPGTPPPKPRMGYLAWSDDEAAMGDQDSDSLPKPFTPARPTLSPAEVKPKTQSKMFGRIGGKKTEERYREEEDEGLSAATTRPSAQERTSPEQKAKPKAKLGAIGHSKVAAPSSASTHLGEGASDGRDRRRAREDTPERGGGGESGKVTGGVPEAVRPRRETSMERADRKRAELKLELAAKAKAPAKKKRKF